MSISKKQIRNILIQNAINIFRIDCPCGIVIRLDTLMYSFFNRNYRQIISDDVYTFEKKIDVSAINKIKEFATQYKIEGTTWQIQKYGEFGDCLYVFFYGDGTFPYDSSGIDKTLIRQYVKHINYVESILNIKIPIFYDTI